MFFLHVDESVRVDTRIIAVVVVTLVLAGCSGGSGAGADAGPEYATNHTGAEMTLQSGDYPDDWSHVGDQDDGGTVRFVSPENDSMVGTNGWVFENISAARSHMAEMQSRYPELNEYNMSGLDAVYWANINEEHTVLFMRDGNAFGVVIAAQRTGFSLSPDRNTAFEHATQLRGKWHRQKESSE